MIFTAFVVALFVLPIGILFRDWAKYFHLEYMPVYWSAIVLVAAIIQMSITDREIVSATILLCLQIPLFGHWIGGYWYRRAGADEPPTPA